MRILVKLLTVKSPLKVTCASSTSVGELKGEIHKKWKIHPGDQRLVFANGKTWPDCAKINDISSSNTVHLVLRLPARESYLF